MISPELLATLPADAQQDIARAQRAEIKTAQTPPLTISDSPAVQTALDSSDRAMRWVGKLAAKDDTAVGIVAKTLLEHNGALPKTTLVEMIDLPSNQVEHAIEAFTGNFVVEQDVVVVEALHPKLEPSGQIYPAPSSDLAKTR